MAKPTMLTGGNPQIPKGEGDAPVRTYLDALDGWQRETCEAVDALVVKTLPGVRKAVKWNSPFYGMPGGEYFLGYHVMTRYVKLNFFSGAQLVPEPPVGSKDPNTRYLHLGPGLPMDEAQLADWVRQASKLPGFGKVWGPAD